MGKLTSADALDLASRFQQLANALTDYKLECWSDLTAAQRRTLDDAEWSLRNNAMDIVTYAVGTVLNESEGSLNHLQAATNKATQAVKKIAQIKDTINIATAAVGLAAAVVSRNADAITQNAILLSDAAAAAA